MVGDAGVRDVLIQRRRWRLFGTTTTRQDRSPDEAGGIRSTLLVVLLKLASWLLSGEGLHVYDEAPPILDPLGCRPTVQHWQQRIFPDAARVQGALRTAVVERSEPQPVE